MSQFKKRPSTEARDRLAAAIEARRDHQAELAAISASLARLSDLAAKPAKIEAGISPIDASGADALRCLGDDGRWPMRRRRTPRSAPNCRLTPGRQSLGAPSL